MAPLLSIFLIISCVCNDAVVIVADFFVEERKDLLLLCVPEMRG
jgi:hypothetical protein